VKPRSIVNPGRYYRATEGGLFEVGPRGVDVWVCRRVADYPGADVPPGGAVAACARCGRAIVFDPLMPDPPAAPKVCLQCAGIVPLALEGA
jgi:hypothetical protein